MNKHDERSCKITLAICLAIMALGCLISKKFKIAETMTMTMTLDTIGFTIVALLYMIGDAIRKLIHNIKSKRQDYRKRTIKKESEEPEDDGYSDKEHNYYEKRFRHDYHRKIF